MHVRFIVPNRSSKRKSELLKDIAMIVDMTTFAHTFLRNERKKLMSKHLIREGVSVFVRNISSVLTLTEVFQTPLMYLLK
ncbi:hypothetical protein PUN28_000550 [Cardiocondyla obscurior]|uniref:Uncharacterized protein n=1 Tax=Cardiocondyla obscurior TaxID=286306 RepID=A0AAW2H010_9HYME